MDARGLTWMLMAMAVCSTSAAQIYKTIDENGSVTFSDTPSTDSEEVKPQALPSNDTIQSPTSEIEPEVTAFNYELIDIYSPENDHSFVNTDGSFVVSLITEPGLRDSDRITLILDGKPYGKPQSSLSFPVKNLNRGSHTITAQIVDPNNNVLATSKLITIFIRKNTILLPAPRKAQPSQ